MPLDHEQVKEESSCFLQQGTGKYRVIQNKLNQKQIIYVTGTIMKNVQNNKQNVSVKCGYLPFKKAFLFTT
jgi:hypothetical protein